MHHLRPNLINKEKGDMLPDSSSMFRRQENCHLLIVHWTNYTKDFRRIVIQLSY